MTLASFVRTDCITVGPLTGVNDIRKKLQTHRAIVVLHEDRYVGMLTLQDLALRPYDLIADCLVPKPCVSPQSKISNAIQLMDQAGVEVLPVKENSRFLGLVYKGDIEEPLANKYNELDDFVTRLLHDTNNMLNHIGTVVPYVKKEVEKLFESFRFLDEDCKRDVKALLDQEVILPDELSRLLGTSQDLCQYMIGLSDRLLKIKRNEEQPELKEYIPTNLNELLTTVIENYSNLAGQKKILFMDDRCKGDLMIKAHKGDLLQALMNLVDNALKFTPEEECVRILTKRRKQTAILQIADNGIGIPENKIPYIFDKMTTIKRKGLSGEKPHGLGLYMVKKIIDQHQAIITVKSREGNGTKIVLTFQLVPAKEG